MPHILIVDYRGYGKSEGKPSEKGLYLDAAPATNGGSGSNPSTGAAWFCWASPLGERLLWTLRTGCRWTD